MADGEVLPQVDQAASTRVGDPHGTDPFQTRPPESRAIPGQPGEPPAMPGQIGRYRVLRLLGEGAFGRVFLARDDELQRDVAVKVPQSGRVARPEDLAQYLAEARTLAQLGHPGIVPVHDVGRTPDGLCCVVSRYVEGANLAARLKGPRLSLEKSLTLVVDVAEALGHAHARGLVHRDVKPANILLDTSGKPILADFGLALREQDFGTGETLTGTPAYMSPEQARGEGHRVDARSDLFSLGVVLFELLTGRLPFQAPTIAALIDKIATTDVPSPRQFEPALPAEAERICLKALARRASDRYATAHDLVEDLRHLLADQTQPISPATVATSQPIALDATQAVSAASPKVVPKGLRSFDAGDADFFLDLLPGPRDRDGLPESLRFWKSRIEQSDPAQSFSVGLIYGPSGCGKSSLMKAGLLPRLSPEVRTVYVEATSDDTEARLCRGLRNLRLPAGAARETLRGVAPDEAGSELVRVLTELRRGAATTATAPRVYLSSSYVDLVAHRAVVLQALQTTGLDYSAMEHYGAADERPAEFCLADVRRCDLYVGIFAHRYGYVPDGAAASITEMEYREARKLGRPTLIFLVAPQATWPESLRETGPGAERLQKLRHELEADRMVAYFESPEELALKVTAAVARWLQGRGPGEATAAPSGGKTLIVIDQFEQWLYAHRDLDAEPLVAALRQCDGKHVQAIVMIRDDFYMPVTRFFEQIDIQLQAGRNQSAVDLFDVPHSRKLLTAFGRAYGQLPEGEPSREQQEFLNQAVEGLAEESKVISVRLALFSEMVKAKPWTVATLRDIGGVSGVGVTFLEETFSAKSAPVASRRHETAARGVLQSLLPEGGTGIKGHRRSEAELLAASGYERRLPDFADLLRLLNTELRLITPIEDADAEPQAGSTSEHSATAGQPGTTHRFYQLTHDYLVPSLRDWLTRKQRETRKGRAELKLAERAVTWNARRENKQLPSVGEWLSIRVLTDTKRWTTSQRLMMRTAARVHGTLWGGLLLTVLLVGTGIQQFVSAERWRTLQEQTQTAAEALQNNLGLSVPLNLEKLRTLPEELVLPKLQSLFSATPNARRKLSLAFALAAYGRLDAAYLASRIDDIEPADKRNYLTALQANPATALAALKAESRKCTAKPLWRRKAKLAIVALHLGDAEQALDVCTFENRPDPEQRTMFIDEFSKWEIDFKSVLEAVKNSESPALRSGICLAVGQVPDEKSSDAEKESWKSVASRWFVEKRDTSTHSAAGWLLRHWKFLAPEIPEPHKMTPERDWFLVKTSGATMLRIRQSSALVSGTPNPTEKPALSEFWVADREVTRGQFEAFINDATYAAAEKPAEWKGVDSSTSPTAYHPVQNVSWYDAILYCNWLSRREGRQVYYERTGTKEKSDFNREYDQWRVVPGASGYRLLREAAWEHACRAGTTTEFSSGDDEKPLAAYCQMSSKLTAVSGEKLPNAWGLHDAHGNVWEWCEDRNSEGGWDRVVRGGGWSSDAEYCRAAIRGTSDPKYGTYVIGFRLALSSPSGVTPEAAVGK